MIHIKNFVQPQSRNEPAWAEHIEPIIVLGRGVPSWSRNQGRWAYCIAGIGDYGQWFRLYPLPIEGGNRLFEPFDIVKPFIIKKHENGRPESCRIDAGLVWKAGTVPDSQRLGILERILGKGTFMHDSSWRKRSLGCIKPLSLQISIEESPTLKFKCGHKGCGGHTTTFFDVLRIEAGKRRLVAPAEEIENLLSKQDEDKLWFVVGTERQHPHIWIVVEILINIDQKVTGLQSWLTSNIRRED